LEIANIQTMVSGDITVMLLSPSKLTTLGQQKYEIHEIPHENCLDSILF
jgi:hypothetical protein